MIIFKFFLIIAISLFSFCSHSKGLHQTSEGSDSEYSCVTISDSLQDPFRVSDSAANCDLISVADSSALDSVCNADSSDTLCEQEQESAFQDEIDSLFIDTTGWRTDKINVGRFDYKSMLDTVRIPIVDTALKRQFVFPYIGPVTSSFGSRRSFWHFGTDLKLNKGDTVRCALDGIVRVIQYDRYGYGKAVVVRHFDGLETIYGHLSQTSLTPNTRLRAGDLIGLGGNTGRSSGSHLHFEIRYGGEPIDPGHFIDFQYCSLKSDTLVLTRESFDYLTELRKTVYHKIRKGETLSGIARHYGTTVKKLCVLNGITGKTILKIGRRIIVRKDTQA